MIKRRMRKFLYFLLFLGIILFIAVNYLVDQVDYQPYFTSEYYEKSRLRLDSLIDSETVAFGEVKAGFAKQSITPGIAQRSDDIKEGYFFELPLAGYGDREGAPVEGTHDSLFVSAVALQVEDELQILLSADLLIIPPNICERTLDLLDPTWEVNRSTVFFSATHTHSSMGGWSDRYVGEIFAGKLNPDLVEWVSQRFAIAIEQALKDVQPASLGVGSFYAPELVENRLIGDKGEEDSEFVLLKIKQKQGKTALLGSFDAHATTITGSNMMFSGDYPGYWRAHLEEKGIDYPVFFAGSVGSHGPTGAGTQFGQASSVGIALADSVLKYEAEIVLADTTQMIALTVELDMPGFQVRISEGMKLDPYTSSELFPTLGATHVQAMRIGSLIWATAPGDFSGEFAIDLKNAMYRLGYYSHITSFNGGYTGYIIPAKYYHYDGYESRVMSWFGPGNGPYIEEMLRRSMLHVAIAE